MNKMKIQTRGLIILLLFVAIVAIFFYLMPTEYPLTGFIITAIAKVIGLSNHCSCS